VRKNENDRAWGLAPRLSGPALPVKACLAAAAYGDLENMVKREKRYYFTPGEGRISVEIYPLPAGIYDGRYGSDQPGLIYDSDGKSAHAPL
jgi:hypothetical protein